MKRKPNYQVSERAAVEILNRIFSSSDRDEMTLEEIYKSAGRSNKGLETNRNWFNGVLAKLKNYKLVDTVNSFENSRNKVVGMKLTIAGKSALGKKIDSSESLTPKNITGEKNTNMSLDDVLSAVAELREKHTKFDIELVIKPKEKPIGR